jgi:hypothetical protein
MVENSICPSFDLFIGLIVQVDTVTFNRATGSVTLRSSGTLSSSLREVALSNIESVTLRGNSVVLNIDSLNGPPLRLPGAKPFVRLIEKMTDHDGSAAEAAAAVDGIGMRRRRSS